MTTPDATTFDRVAAARKSVRAFLPAPVPRQTVEDILRVAARAPSGNNIQPWRVHVLSGPTLRQVVKEACAAFDAADGSYTPEYGYYPSEFVEPYRASVAASSAAVSTASSASPGATGSACWPRRAATSSSSARPSG